jgi:hypothetical protein
MAGESISGMRSLSRFARYLGTREGRTSSAIIVSSGVVLGIFLYLTFVNRLPAQYYLDFGSAKWIQRAGARRLDAAYFRGTLYVPGPVTAGWIQIAATGTYQLYVNDVEVDASIYPGVRLTGLYDVKELLAPGKNVVAVYVAGGDYPGPAQVLVRGSYRVASSAAREFASGPNWKVSPIAKGIVNSYQWSSQALNDTLWENAIVAKVHERFSMLQPLSFDPKVIKLTPWAHWIEGRAQLRQESFIRHIALPRDRGETWLQVASPGAYDLIINGHFVAAQPEVAQTRMIGADRPVLAAPGLMVNSGQMSKAVSPTSTDTGTVTPSVAGLPPLVPDPPLVVSAANQLLNNQLATNQPTINQQIEVPEVTSPGPESTSPARTQSAIALVTTMPAANGVVLRNSIIAPVNPGTDETTEMPDLASLTYPLQSPMPQLISPPLYLGTIGTAPLLIAYNLTNWVHAGDNIIFIRVRTHYGPALLLAEGYTNLNGRIANPFATDGSWRILNSPDGANFDTVRMVARYGDRPWGVLPQVAGSSQSLPGHTVRQLARWTAAIVAAIGLVALLWFGTSSLVVLLKSGATEHFWTIDALLHLPLLLGLLFLWLLSFDVRIRSDWCFVPAVLLGAIGYLAVSKLVLAFARPSNPEKPALAKKGSRGRLALAALGIIVLLGFELRRAGMLTVSLGHDEGGMIFYSWAILKRGLPVTPDGSFQRWLSTYELVPYIMALSSRILGTTVFAYRLPSLIFSTLTIGLIGWFGYRIKDWRVGLVSALIYACLPYAINWGQDGFYPSQQCFFATLTFWAFYEAIRDPGLHGRYVTLCGISIVLTYFSWEASGFLIPVLLMAVIVCKWGEFEWMGDGHLWRVFGVVAALIVMQLSYRQIVTLPDYMGVGRNLSEMTSPRLAFLDRVVFNPYFYLRAEFFLENHFVLTLLVLIGALVAWRNVALLYLYVCLLMLEVMYTGFLAMYAPRYCFYWTPVLVLAGVGTFFYLTDRIRELTTVSRLGVGLGALSLYAGVALLILATNPFVLKLYRLSADPSGVTYFSRLGVNYKQDYRASFLYVASHVAPGDVVLSDGPAAYVYRFYASEWPDFTVDSILHSKNNYDGTFGPPQYRDRSGLAMIRNLQDLAMAQSQSGRVWLVGELINGPKIKDYVQAWGRNVFETAQQKVVVFTGVPSSGLALRISNNSDMIDAGDIFPRPWIAASMPVAYTRRVLGSQASPGFQPPVEESRAGDPHNLR